VTFLVSSPSNRFSISNAIYVNLQAPECRRLGGAPLFAAARAAGTFVSAHSVFVKSDDVELNNIYSQVL
jgi:hypothetical protein